MEQSDVLIIGAGLLGCFAARALSAYELRVTVLEAREDVCTGISRANTGILYAGYDTKPGTLKSRLTVKASGAISELCRTLDVPVSICGSLMIACGERSESVLKKKFSDGQDNGVPGLQLLSGKEVLSIEPNLAPCITAGLYAPTTGTLNPWELGIAAYENALANGVEFHFNEELKSLFRSEDGFVAETDFRTYRVRAVINCAGLSADRVRELCESPLIRLIPSAADYLVLDSGTGNFVNHIIFHEPEQKSKGLTLVPTRDGNLLVGPTEREVTFPGATSRYGLDTLTTLCRNVVPALDMSQSIRNFSSLRPNPYYVHEENGNWIPEKRSIGNFTVLEENGLFSLIGIKTPGLTCACELGIYTAKRVVSHLGSAAQRADFNPYRRAIPIPDKMNAPERNTFISSSPNFGRILCRCRGVSEGEVIEAIRRGAVTIDGVKRRTGAGMGRCQGSFCQQKIIAVLARELKLPPERIAQDAPGSEQLLSKIP